MYNKVFYYRQDILASTIGLSTLAKLLLSSFMSVAYCHKSNTFKITVEYYAKMYGTTVTRIKHAINNLMEKGFITLVQVSQNKNGEYACTFDLEESVNDHFPDAVHDWGNTCEKNIFSNTDFGSDDEEDDEEDCECKDAPKFPFNIPGIKGAKINSKTAAKLLKL